MGEPARGHATWEDLLKIPEDDRFRYEVLGGEIEGLPHPLPQHGWTQGMLFADLSSPFGRGRGGPGGWWLILETDVILGPHDIVAPDITGWRRERMPAFPRTRPIILAPDWVCEVLSPSHPQRDRVRKADLYLRARIPHYWMLDVEGRTLEALTAREGAWVRAGAWTDGDSPHIPPFEAIELDVGGLFPPLDAEDSPT
ncbi:MAG: Uma2 family endonuclease [Vicinamibacteria bacterium]